MCVYVCVRVRERERERERNKYKLKEAKERGKGKRDEHTQRTDRSPVRLTEYGNVVLALWSHWNKLHT